MKKEFLFLLIVLTTFLLAQCKQQNVSADPNQYKIDLKWFKAYPEENTYKVEVGLKWIMAYLGAELLTDNYSNSIQWKEGQVLSLNVEHLGFSASALKSWKIILRNLKKSKNYQKNKWIDIGQFISFVFNNTNSYYAITGVSKTLSDFKNKYNFDDTYDYVINKSESCVSPGFRFINVGDAASVSEIAYIAKEGFGDKVEGFQVKEFEVIDFMKNGQPRFAIYNLDGKLLPGADELVTTAGKPAKCMWCHTSKIARLLFAETETKGYGKLKNFSKIIATQNKMLRNHWTQTNQSFVADSIKQHSYAELLYVTYEDPTLYRLRNEGVEEELLNKIKNETHQNVEYKFFNKLVLDSVIARKALFPSFNITTRETNENEINLLN